MLKLEAIKSEKIWGYELWFASTHPNGCQKDFKSFVNADYPLIGKIIHSEDSLSIQVHPDDEKALLYENSRGKSECWYVLDAGDDAELVYGLKKSYSKQELKNAIEGGTLEECLSYVKVKKGDFIFIPSGTVHAIGRGMRLLEIQQSSDVTYRLYDFNRGRECHIEKGLGCIKNDNLMQVKTFSGFFECPYFSLETIEIKDSYFVDSEKDKKVFDSKDIVLYFILEGNVCVNGLTFSKEEAFASRTDEELSFKGSCKIMKIKCLSD